MMRIRKILLELDPLKDNGAALDRTRSVASSFGSEVDVVVCRPPQVIPPLGLGNPEVVAVAHDEHQSDVENWARAQVADLTEAGIPVTVKMTELQPQYEAITSRADEFGADLIVRTMGQQGRLKRLFLGANDWDLIRHAKQPLWLVQKNNETAARANVLAAVDPNHPNDEHMKLDKRLLDFADGLGKILSGSLHVYHTFQPVPPVSAAPSGVTMAPPSPLADPEMLKKVESAHKNSLDPLIADFDVADDRVHLVPGDPAAEIEKVIEANEIGVVVAGAVSRSWLDRLLIGSTAESFLDVVSCDLLLLKDDAS